VTISWQTRFSTRYSWFWLEVFGAIKNAKPLPALELGSQEVIDSFRRVLSAMTAQRDANALYPGWPQEDDEAEFQASAAELAAEAARQLHYVWLVQVKEYEAACIDDINTFLRYFTRWMSMARTNVYLDGTLSTHTNLSDFSFNAFIAPTPGARLEECRVYLSGGVLFALDDLACRSFCNQAMLAWDVSRDCSTWEGCQCYFASLNQPGIRPAVRYWNYAVADADLLEMRLDGPWRSGLLPAYFSGMPIGSPGRMNAAAFAATVGLSWIFAHEESHYRNGHIHMLAGPEGGEQMLFAEGGSSDLPVEDLALRRALEWNADCSATNAVIDVYFDETHLGELPENCPKNAEWLLRLVIAGMLLPAMLFDRASQFRKSTGDHPSGLCRLICIIAAACRRIGEMTRPGPGYRADIARFVNASRDWDLLALEYRVVMGSMVDVSIVGEILENERNEGRDPAPYEHPMGRTNSIPYLVYETFRTMYRPATFEFIAQRIPAPPPSEDDPRFADTVFDEVKSYLHREPDTDPLMTQVRGYSDRLVALHQDKILRLLGRETTGRLFGSTG
jgi:hypothetical protein